MSLFTSLYELARVAPLNILITAEGNDQLRINVTPQQAKDAARKLWPLSIAGTPTELDEQFADSVAVYEPGALSVLDQARACAAANQSHSAPALPSPSASEAAGTPSKRGRGRPPKAAKADDANNPPATDGANAGTTDPRQMRIDDTGQPTDAGVDLY